MKILEREYVETLEKLLFGSPLEISERERLTSFAHKEGGSLSLNECFEILEYGKILTPEQRKRMVQHEEWLEESYAIEEMDQVRESWL